MRFCIFCRHPVSNGDRHALYACPPLRGKKRRKNKNRRHADIPERGTVVAGTGVPKGAAKG